MLSYAELLTPYYRAVAEAGAEAGLLMFGHDHLGHGRSQGERGQIGDISEYVSPVIQHCQIIRAQQPNLPLFIIGHSMGGLVAVLAILKTQVSNFMAFFLDRTILIAAKRIIFRCCSRQSSDHA